MPDSPKPGRDAGAAVRVLATGTMCLDCLVDRSALAIDRVQSAIALLDGDGRLIHERGRCRFCLRRDRALLRLDESSTARRPFAITYDEPARSGGVRCAKCGRLAGAVGQGVVVSGGLAYHTGCYDGPSRKDADKDGGAEAPTPVLCRCGHSRELHQYERRLRAWTVCRGCRCVRFKVPSPPLVDC